VDEPSGGAGVDGLAVGVVDADADAPGRGRAPDGGAGQSLAGSPRSVAAVITLQQLIVAAAIIARTHFVM